MSPSDLNHTPPQLAGFAEPVCAAYERYLRTNKPEAAQEVILGALKGFLPDSSPAKDDPVLKDSMRLVEDLGYDSLAVAEVVFFIEDLFQVQIDSNDLKIVKTVGDLREFVRAKLTERSLKA
jgi:acyl carrier protein